MAIYRDKPCSSCNGKGYITILNENSIGCIGCKECFNTGIVQRAITNSERIAELHTPEDQLKFFRGFARWAKYAGTPLRLIFPESDDEEMLEWLNKVSDETDNIIFENRE